MNSVLLDTNVFSYLMKPGNPLGELYRPEIKGKLLVVSFVTVGELLFGAKNRGWGAAKLADLETRLKAVVIAPYDYQVCQRYAEIKAASWKAGKPRSDNDLWIASTAVRHGIPIVTHNAPDFSDIDGLTVITKLPPKKPKEEPEEPELFA